jgi:CheY-like chemotaxis protein
MSRLLLVEDVEGTLDQLYKLLTEVFADFAHIDPARSVAEGLQLIERAARERLPYDVAILDFKLPRESGHHPEIDESLCRAIQEQMRHTLVIHITAFPQDPLVLSHLERWHNAPTEPRASCVSKLNGGWARELIETLQSYLYGSRIQEQLEELLGVGASGAALPARATTRTRGDRSLTHSLARLCRDISAYWPYLDAFLKKRINTYFVVDADQHPIRVGLKPRSHVVDREP